MGYYKPKPIIMELKTQLNALADKVHQLKDQIQTEESTKTAFVLPFIHLLGYDIFNPTEVKPEFTADIGIKKGEKVDYAIFIDQKPVLIIECKNWREKLDTHNSQLFRYFHTTTTRFAILTNGIDYKFFSDLEKENIMDTKPFLDFNITKLKDNTIKEISKFHKSNFNEHDIYNSASDLMYISEFRKEIDIEFNDPSREFVKYFANKIISGRMTSNLLESVTPLLKTALNQYVSNKVNDRLNAALDKEADQQEKEEIEIEEPISKIQTTEEELEGYQIVVAILRRVLPKHRIVHRDTQSYFGILLDDNNRKPLCRLHLNGNTKYIGIFDENKSESKMLIESIDDIYKFEADLLRTVQIYE